MLLFAPVRMPFIETLNTSEIPVGRVKAYSVGERTIAVYHTAGGFFATDNTCPHRGGPLAEGDLIGNEITCPWHLWGFDVATGICAGNPDIRVAAHPVRVENERVMVELP
jgi:nitrite reductase/ring-hydroxylating ferredoxin subunit